MLKYKSYKCVVPTIIIVNENVVTVRLIKCKIKSSLNFDLERRGD